MIIETLRVMNRSTSEVSSSAQEMIEGNKLIFKNIADLQESSGVMKTTMDEMKSSIDEIGGQINQFTV